jgi:ABC-type antimicrobial peptide transport system permease subunit
MSASAILRCLFLRGIGVVLAILSVFIIISLNNGFRYGQLSFVISRLIKNGRPSSDVDQEPVPVQDLGSPELEEDENKKGSVKQFFLTQFSAIWTDFRSWRGWLGIPYLEVMFGYWHDRALERLVRIAW